MLFCCKSRSAPYAVLHGTNCTMYFSALYLLHCVLKGVAGSGSPLELEAANKLVSSTSKRAQQLQAVIVQLSEVAKVCVSEEALNTLEVHTHTCTHAYTRAALVITHT